MTSVALVVDKRMIASHLFSGHIADDHLIAKDNYSGDFAGNALFPQAPSTARAFREEFPIADLAGRGDPDLILQQIYARDFALSPL
jgi:hypothetical protein